MRLTHERHMNRVLIQRIYGIIKTHFAAYTCFDARKLNIICADIFTFLVVSFSSCDSDVFVSLSL